MRTCTAVIEVRSDGSTRVVDARRRCGSPNHPCVSRASRHSKSYFSAHQRTNTVGSSPASKPDLSGCMSPQRSFHAQAKCARQRASTVGAQSSKLLIVTRPIWWFALFKLSRHLGDESTCRELRISKEVRWHRAPQPPQERDRSLPLVRHVVCGSQKRVRSGATANLRRSPDEQQDI